MTCAESTSTNESNDAFRRLRNIETTGNTNPMKALIHAHHTTTKVNVGTSKFSKIPTIERRPKKKRQSGKAEIQAAKESPITPAMYWRSVTCQGCASFKKPPVVRWDVE